ncbi:unnamed protein product [Leuciscus chuanchicus]
MFQKLPRVLRQRITAQYKWHRDKENILDIVSEQLRKDIMAEISFLFGGRQLATVSALTTCSLFTLSLQGFQEIEKEFPHVVNELRGAA